MTVLTKQVSDKKCEKLITKEEIALHDAENGDARPLATNNRKTSIVISIAAITILFLGLLGGVALHLSYIQEHNHHFHGFCGVPYDSSAVRNSGLSYMNSPFGHEETTAIPISELLEPQKYFNEEFELGLDDDDSFSKIIIPDFRDGRIGGFYHDFMYNQSCIVDAEARRCFIMPLDRTTVVLPRNLFDLIMKMQRGVYDIDTSLVKRTMRVVLPAIEDVSEVSPNIVDECAGSKIYMLEKFVSGVSKRSIDEIPDSGKFGAFSGKGIVAYDIVNIRSVEAYEKTVHFH